jgi:hypothetical protein
LLFQKKDGEKNTKRPAKPSWKDGHCTLSPRCGANPELPKAIDPFPPHGVEGADRPA